MTKANGSTNYLNNVQLPIDQRLQFLNDFVEGAKKMGVEIDTRYIKENFSDHTRDLWADYDAGAYYANALKIRVHKNVRWVAQNLDKIKFLLHIDCSRTLPTGTRYTIVTDRMEFGKAWGVGWMSAPYYSIDPDVWPVDETYIFPGRFNENTGSYLLGRYLS